MENVIIWAGPVAQSHLSGAALPVPARVVTFGGFQGGIGSSAFFALGQSVDGDLGELLARRAIDIDRCRSITLALFSAGWGLAESLLRRAPNRARISAVLACDAYYTGEDLTPKPGFRAWATQAAARNGLAVFSTSSHRGLTYPSSDAGVAKLLEPLRLEPAKAPSALPLPLEAKQAGNLFWYRYGDTLKHAEHATRVAPAALTSIVTPYLTKSDGAGPVLAAAVGLVMLTGNPWGRRKG